MLNNQMKLNNLESDFTNCKFSLFNEGIFFYF